MRANCDHFFRPNPLPVFRLLSVAVLALVSCGSPALLAQTVVAPVQPGAAPLPTTIRQNPLRQPGSTTPAPVPEFLIMGPVTLRPHAFYRFIRASDLQTRPGETVDSTIQNLAAGVSAELGRHWVADYQASWNVYSNEAFDDTVDQMASVIGRTSYESWDLYFSQEYSNTDQPLIQTGRQTSEELYTTVGNIVYRIGGRYTLETDLRQQLRYTSEFNDSKEWTGMEWLHLRLTPMLDWAVGFGPGYIEVNNGSDTTYYQLKGKVDYRFGEKLSAHAEAGFDRRKTSASASKFHTTLIYSGGVNYAVSERTVLFASASRSLAPSYFGGETERVTDASAGIQQQVFTRFQASLSVGYRRTSYQSDIPAVIVDRRDDNQWFALRVGTRLANRTTGGVFYRHTENDSTELGYDFSSEQIGFDLAYRF